MSFTVLEQICDMCGVKGKCLRISSENEFFYVDVCAEDMARGLQELTGFKMLNMYRTMKVQHETKDTTASYRNTRTVLPKGKK